MMSWSACLLRSATDLLGPHQSARPATSYTTGWDTMGASAVVRHASRGNGPVNSWLAGMLARKPRMLVIVALTNKMARTAWALLARGEVYRTPAAAA